MKRKLFALILVLGLSLSLAACSGGASQGGGTAATPAPAPAGTQTPAQTAADSDVAYVKEKGSLIVGITDFAPMDYKNDSGEWIGFDADMAKAFAASLGVTAEFIEINWDNKIMELDTKAIDCVWNGMTLTEEVTTSMQTSIPYCLNGQVVVLPAGKAEDYATVESLSSLNFAVENGSAGAAQLDALGIPYTAKLTQADALLEVASGASDACVIDLLMAGAMIGEGTSYPNLVHTEELTTEEYGVGCRKGSDLASYINLVFAQSYADGSMQKVAEAYGVQEALVEQKAAEFTASDSDSDVAYIQGKGTLIVGITEFEPMDYKDDSGEWIGFDADMARVVAEKLGVEAQFVVIDWDNKVMELDSKNIDVVWNGMTLTNEVTSAMECTNAYCNNAQVIVVPAK